MLPVRQRGSCLLRVEGLEGKGLLQRETGRGEHSMQDIDVLPLRTKLADADPQQPTALTTAGA